MKILDDIDSQLRNARNRNQGKIQDNLEQHQDLRDMGKSLLTEFDKNEQPLPRKYGVA